jgi:hypothetical protein
VCVYRDCSWHPSDSHGESITERAFSGSSEWSELRIATGTALESSQSGAVAIFVAIAREQRNVVVLQDPDCIRQL